MSLHSELYICTSDNAEFNLHSVKRFPQVGHLHKLGGFDWKNTGGQHRFQCSYIEVSLKRTWISVGC
jgi:hypothetical protein